MEKQKSTGISLMTRFDNLKSLVEQKIKLEQENKQKSSDYVALNKIIETLIAPLSSDHLKFLKTYCNQELTNLSYVLRSDVTSGVKNHVHNKEAVLEGCLSVVNKYASLKKNSEPSR